MNVFEEIALAITSVIAAMGVWGEILVNAIGVIAVISLLLSYQMKNRAQIFTWYAIATLSWLVYFVLKGDFASTLMSIIGLFRTYVFRRRGQEKWADSILWLFFFLIVMLGISALTFKDARDLFPLAATALSTIAFFAVKEKNLRLINLCAYLAWIGNGITKFYWVALIGDVATFISLVIALIRFHKSDKESVSKREETVEN